MSKKKELAIITSSMLSIEYKDADKAGDVALRIYKQSGKHKVPVHFASTRSKSMTADSNGFSTPCPADFDKLQFELTAINEKKEVKLAGDLVAIEEEPGKAGNGEEAKGGKGEDGKGQSSSKSDSGQTGQSSSKIDFDPTGGKK